MFRFSFHKSDSEERLLQRMQQGDTSAAEPLYRLHVRYLSALCSRYLTDDEDIKDVLQESFLRIFSSIASFEYRGKGSLKGWMAKITLNETLKFLRARSQLDFVDIADLPHDVPDTDLQTEGIPTDVLHRFVRELPDGYRTVFNLYVVDDKSHKEIASLLGIKESTSASQLHKAKAMLARKIKQYRTSNSFLL